MWRYSEQVQYFKHIVRAKTIKGVHVLNLREGYSLIKIVSPREFI